MNARRKINQYFATVSIVLAAWIGLGFNSWIAFGVSAAILLGLNMLGGSIRFSGPTRHHRPAEGRHWNESEPARCECGL